MSAIENYEYIDYDELLACLNEDISSGVLTPDSDIYIIRQNNQVKITGTDKVVNPIVEFFYTSPELETNLSEMAIVDLKKLAFESIEVLSKTETPTDLTASLSEISKIIADELKTYTKNNSKRNNELCKVIMTKAEESFQAFPMMFFYKDDNVMGSLETIKVAAVIDEINGCQNTNE